MGKGNCPVSPISISMASSKRRASITSSIAFFVHFLLIIFQVPLFRFRVPYCRNGRCTSPMEVTSSHLIATQLYPAFGVKAFLYPGAIAKAYIDRKPIPTYTKLSNLYNFTNSRKAPPPSTHLYHLEILAGSYLAVAGAVLGLLRTTRMSLFGTLLISWGCVREIIILNIKDKREIEMYPATMSIAVLSAFLSIKKDVRKLIRCCTRTPGQKAK